MEKEVKKSIKKAVNSVYGVSIEEDSIVLERPKDESFGDYATTIALSISKEMKKSPIMIANELVEKLQKDIVKYGEVKAVAPGFINITISESWYVDQLDNILKQKDSYGKNNWGNGEKWVIEHTSPNPNKAMHLGHLRNNVTGMAIANIWEFSGVSVVRDCIDNNRGIAIAKMMWGFLVLGHKEEKNIADISYWSEHKNEWHTPESMKMSPDKFAERFYILADDEFKKNELVEKEIRELVVAWENDDKLVRELWAHILKYSYEGQQLTLNRIGNKWDNVWHEHEHYKEGKDFVKKGVEKGFFTILEDGAVLTNLSVYDLTDTILQKSDGTSLYITQDIALTHLKKKKYKADRLFWVIGPEQSLAMKQMFAVCDQLGIAKYDSLTHIPYGYMSLKGQGKMSSRLGNVVYIDDLIDLVKFEIKKKIDPEKFTDNEIEKMAETLAVGAVKYSILKVGRTVDTSFDLEESVNLEGNSALYLEYTYVRTQSVLKNSDEKISSLIAVEPFVKEEASLIRHICRWEETILNAAQEYHPHVMCVYLFELAQRYNALYNAHSILKADTNEQKKTRLILTAITGNIIKTGLEILGIDSVERM